MKYVVIDEIHSFVGSDRGIQLMSILYRLQEQNSKQFNIVGLSATISEENKFSEVKQFTGNEEKTKVLIDRTTKEIEIEFRYFENKNEELPSDLLDDLYNETKESKVLVFPNSRGKAEEVAVKLQKLSSRLKGHSNYFSHHSSVDKEVREYVEYFAKSNRRQNFCISCTSTLELGIDIGTVDKIVQIDAAHSIASLIQRTGRSGRRNDEKSNLFLYSTEQWSLLQSVASWLLYKQGFIEPPAISKKPYDILLHQALSITKGHSGLNINELF
ncbi:MAG: helicase-related protein, partial [Flammeovirgaceae bacterium]